MKRTLTLTRESLAPLGDAELAGVAGGAERISLPLTCPVNECLSGESRITCLDCYETRPCTG